MSLHDRMKKYANFGECILPHINAARAEHEVAPLETTQHASNIEFVWGARRLHKAMFSDLQAAMRALELARVKLDVIAHASEYEDTNALAVDALKAIDEILKGGEV